jgi:integrase
MVLALPLALPETLMAAKLTTVAVRNAKPDPARRREIPDAGSGLYLIVQPSGSKGWALRYRSHGKPVKLTLGPVLLLDDREREPDGDPEVGKPLTLRAARDLASTLLRRVARGEDPATKKRLGRAAVREARDDFETVAADFVERYVRPSNRAGSARETERLLRTKVLPVWRGRRIGDIRRRDVVELLDEIADAGAPVSANRTLAAVRRLFNWCIERDIVQANPCAGVRPPAQELSRDRVLSDEELALIWRAAGEIGEPFGPFVKLLILTAQRRDEVAGMRWSEVDLNDRLWTLPRERVKNDSAHDVPLSSQAVDVLEDLPRLAGTPDFVLTTGNGRTTTLSEADRRLVPISGFSKAKMKLDEAIVRIRRQAAEEGGGDPTTLKPMANWRFHDLRRTAASGMARLGIQVAVVEKILNHTSGTFAGVVGVYQRHGFADEKRIALERWADFVTGSGRTPTGAIIPLRQVGA